MPRWTWTCKNCNFPFTHTYIVESNVFHYMEPAKPEIPYGGEEHECPNCGHKAVYHRTELTYAT